MFEYMDYILSEEDKDKLKLAVVKLLFDNGISLIGGVFVNEVNGCKTVKLEFKPKECENHD